jgi:hypothetical protein
MDANNGTAAHLRATWQTVRRRHGPNSPGGGLHLPQLPRFQLPQVHLPSLTIPASITARLRSAVEGIQDVTVPLWAGWMILTIVAWLAGALLVDALSARSGDASTRLLIAAVYGGAVGLMQWFVVRARMREAWLWGLLTAPLITAGVITDRAFGIPLPGSSTVLLMAAAQAALLYSRTPGPLAVAWLPINAITWLLAVSLTSQLPATIPAVAHTPLAALIFGLLTGILIQLFLRGPGRYADAPLMLRLRILGIGWRDIATMIAVLLLIVALVGFILQPCNPAAILLKLGQCAR